MRKNLATVFALLALALIDQTSAFAGDPPAWIANLVAPGGSEFVHARPMLRPPGLPKPRVDWNVLRSSKRARALESPPLPASSAMSAPLEAGQSLSLQAALYGAITGNPDLIALRNSNVASPEAVEVARRFPTTLNPTLWVEHSAPGLDPQ